VVQAARDVPDEGPAPLEELDRRRSRRKVGVVLLWNRGLARLALDRLVVVLAGALAQLPAAVVVTLAPCSVNSFVDSAMALLLWAAPLILGMQALQRGYLLSFFILRI